MMIELATGGGTEIAANAPTVEVRAAVIVTNAEQRPDLILAVATRLSVRLAVVAAGSEEKLCAVLIVEVQVVVIVTNADIGRDLIPAEVTR